MKTPPPPDDAALDALFAAARAARPDTARAEYGFETRLRAHLSATESEEGGWMEFAAWCWRLFPALAVVTLATGLWACWPGMTASADESFLADTDQPLPVGDDDLTRWLAFDWLTPI